MEIVSRASDAFPPAEPAGVADQPPRTREVTASFGSGIDYLGSVAADANISASRVARRAAALQPNQSFWPGALGSPDPAPLAIKPTIYPMPPGTTVTVEDPVFIDARSTEFRDSKETIERLCLAIQQSNQVASEVGDKLVAELKAGLEYIAGPKPSRNVLDLLLVNPLYAAAVIFAGTAVAELAKLAVKALFKLISPDTEIGL